MAGSWTTVSILDGGGTARTMRAWDESGTGAGPFSFASTIADLTGAGSVVIKAASTAAAATDESLVTNESPNSQLSATTGVTTGVAVVTDANGTLQGYLRGLVKLIAAGIGVSVSNANANGRALPTASAPVVLNSMTSQFVAASATAAQLGTTGAATDYLDGLLVIPLAAAAGTVSVLWDGTNTREVFAGGGTTALPTLAPFYVPCGFVSGNAGGFKITTTTNVQVIAVGNFT